MKVTGEELNRCPDKILALRKYDLEYYLPGSILAKVDRMSMASSLEVRTPFLTASISRVALNLNSECIIKDGQSKAVLRSLLSEYLGNDIANLPKQGFAFPESSWVKESLTREFQKMLAEKNLPIENFISFEQLEYELEASKIFFDPYRVWSLLVLNSWLKVNSFSAEKKNQIEPTEIFHSNIRILINKNHNPIRDPEILKVEEETLRVYLSAIAKVNIEKEGNSLLILGYINKKILRKLLKGKYSSIIHIANRPWSNNPIKIIIGFSIKNIIRNIWLKNVG
jgi:hypothetical protein